MAKFNSFEEAIDFSFWKNICIEHGTLRFSKTGLIRQYINIGIEPKGGETKRVTTPPKY